MHVQAFRGSSFIGDFATAGPTADRRSLGMSQMAMLNNSTRTQRSRPFGVVTKKRCDLKRRKPKTSIGGFFKDERHTTQQYNNKQHNKHLNIPQKTGINL